MDNDKQIICTSRLFGETIDSSHWPFWKKMGANSVLMANIGGTWDETTALKKLRWNIDHWQRNGFGQWMFFDKTNCEFIGRCGLRKMEVDGKMEIELGYSVIPTFWRQGYASEMAMKAVEIGFGKLNFPNVVAFTTYNNIASQKTIQKLGFEFETEFNKNSIEHLLYRKTNVSLMNISKKLIFPEMEQVLWKKEEVF